MRSHRQLIGITATYVTLLLGFSGAAVAQEGGRAGTWEAGFNIADSSSDTLSGSRAGVTLDIDGDTSWGGTASYNLTDRLAVGGDIWFSSPNYRATRVLDNGQGTTVTVDASLDIWTIQLKGTYNFMQGGFTPFVEAGAGWTEFDSNIASGPPTTGCWWDPWWGYICTSFYETYTDTRTSIMYGAGVRWELGAGMVLRGSYTVQDIETNQSSEDADLEFVRFDLLWRF